LPREFDAVALVFDQFWDESGDRYGKANGDPNFYITGRIGKHNVVLATLPTMGNTSAAAVTASLRMSYTGLRLGILVGICGGVPHIAGSDAFLGDVVVSKSIVQYDYGKQYPGYFAVRNTVENSLGSANGDIRSLLAVSETVLIKGRLQKDTSNAYRKQPRGRIVEPSTNILERSKINCSLRNIVTDITDGVVCAQMIWTYSVRLLPRHHVRRPNAMSAI